MKNYVIISVLLFVTCSLGGLLFVTQMSLASKQSMQQLEPEYAERALPRGVRILGSRLGGFESRAVSERQYLQTVINSDMAELFSSIDQGDYFNSVLMGGISSGPFGHMVMGSIVSDRRVAKIIEHEGDVGN